MTTKTYWILYDLPIDIPFYQSPHRMLGTTFILNQKFLDIICPVWTRVVGQMHVKVCDAGEDSPCRLLISGGAWLKDAKEYADDIAIFITSDTLEHAHTKAQSAITNLETWEIDGA
ncbi:unnamed protein product [Meganyctiphanes norvegica]|uniref:YCII-related domain-containing protein n=1 Tax=Meganyctiphanes norvegica TaxID=48144 RepID=A0AAV2S2A2_MEGNR